jgi:hypothetical protein
MGHKETRGHSTSVCKSLMLHTPVNAWHVGRNGVRSVRNNAAFNPIGNDQARFEREPGLYHQSCVEGKYPGGIPADWLVIGIDPGYINVSATEHGMVFMQTFVAPHLVAVGSDN